MHDDGKESADVKIARLETRLDILRETIVNLRKELDRYVPLDRYVWLERAFIATIAGYVGYGINSVFTA